MEFKTSFALRFFLQPLLLNNILKLFTYNCFVLPWQLSPQNTKYQTGLESRSITIAASRIEWVVCSLLTIVFLPNNLLTLRLLFERNFVLQITILCTYTNPEIFMLFGIGMLYMVFFQNVFLETTCVCILWMITFVETVTRKH